MPHPTTLKTYASRITLHTNPTARRILTIMDRKRTNLCVSVDVTRADEVLGIVKMVGASVCMVKVNQKYPKKKAKTKTKTKTKKKKAKSKKQKERKKERS